MIDLPVRTNVYKLMPKELFFKYLNDANTLKKTFIDEIRSITRINTINTETMGMPTGNVITTIAIVEIILNRQAISPNLIEIISREIGEDVLYVVRYEEWGQIWCRERITVERHAVFGYESCFCQTNWVNYGELSLSISGEDLDQVYEGLYSQVTGKNLSLKSITEDQENQEGSENFITENERRINDLVLTIKNLEIQINKEKQFSKQVKLVTELKNARNEFEQIKRLSGQNYEQFSNSTSQSVQETYQSVRSFFPNVLMLF